VDQEGCIFRQEKTGTDPEEIRRFLEACDVPLKRVGLQNEYGKCPEHRQASSNH
jgi:hypothetical protein